MTRCSAPWYEINITAADEVVSPCCYYSGPKDIWLNQPVDIATYWNSPAMRAVRRIHGFVGAAEPNGCSNCFYFQNRGEGGQYFDFAAAEEIGDLSATQRENLRRARDDFNGGREETTSTPLRIYGNFGFACNIDCVMCHLVPQRRANRKQISADTLLAWREALAAALEVSVIGGEPFALPEAVRFIRGFIADPAYDAVRLVIFTNGTLHHKHLDVLRRKRKLSMAISLDSIGDGFERIRVKGKWSVVEQNILQFLELQRTTHPEWRLTSSALIQKTGIPLLPRFAEFHAAHNIDTQFYDFINYRGTEDAYHDENVLHYPQLLDDLPDWEDYFDQAINIFARARLPAATSSLTHYRARLFGSVAAYRASAAERARLQVVNNWRRLLTCRGAGEIAAAFAYWPAPGAAVPLFARTEDGVLFTQARQGDSAATTSVPVGSSDGGVLRCRLRWGALAGRRRAHVTVQGKNGVELEAERQLFTNAGGRKEIVLTARVPYGLDRVRLVAEPTGEDASVLPDLAELEFAPISESEDKGAPGFRDRMAALLRWILV